MKKNNVIIIILVIIIFVFIVKQNGFIGGLINPPADYNGCNIAYRSNFQSWNANSASGGGSASAYWVYYNGETYSLGNNGNAPAGVCDLATGDEVQIYGGIYYSASSDRVIWIGTNSINSAEQCTAFNNDVQADANVITSTCHISLNTFWGGVNQKTYLDWVLCNNDGVIGVCQSSDSCTIQGDISPCNVITRAELGTIINNWISGFVTRMQLGQAIQWWVG